MAERCPMCGGAVKVFGETTLHYEPVEDEREANRVREVLRTLHLAVLNVGGGPLHDLYRNSDLRNLVEKAIWE